MLDAIALAQLQDANAQAAAAKRRAFLHVAARGCLTRRGYVVFTLLWLGRTTTRAQKAEIKAAEAAGLITWGCTTGPNVVATLTDAGREAIK
jgi:hypothetical protein